jgi:hypothetical protein
MEVKFVTICANSATLQSRKPQSSLGLAELHLVRPCLIGLSPSFDRAPTEVYELRANVRRRIRPIGKDSAQVWVWMKPTRIANRKLEFE